MRPERARNPDIVAALHALGPLRRFASAAPVASAAGWPVDELPRALARVLHADRARPARRGHARGVRAHGAVASTARPMRASRRRTAPPSASIARPPQRATPALRRVAGDEQSRTALLRDDRRAAATRLRELVAAPGGPIAAALSIPPAGGSRRPARPARSLRRPRPSQLPGRAPAGHAQRLGHRARTPSPGGVTRLTDLDVALYRRGRLLAADFPDPPATPPSPDARELTSGGTDYRVRTGRSRSRSDPRSISCCCATPPGSTRRSPTTALAILALVGVFLIAAIARGVARRPRAHGPDRHASWPPPSGSRAGDFSHPVPVRGSDEFAQLGDEFNEHVRPARVARSTRSSASAASWRR